MEILIELPNIFELFILVLKNQIVFQQLDLDEKILENKKLEHHKFLKLHFHIN